MEDQDYAATGIGGVNSNSAAVAVAEESAQQEVEVPGDAPAPGARKADKVRFDKDGDGKADIREYPRPKERE